MVEVISFADAIKDSAGLKRHLLVGNGFSISARPDIFTYKSLFEQSGISDDERLSAVFQALDTTDFEYAIRALDRASKIVPIYVDDFEDPRAAMLDDASRLKDILIQTVANNHPDGPFDMREEEFLSCQEFLSNFMSGDKAGVVFTLNYDLLLYWTLMQSKDSKDRSALRVDDGFGNDEDDPTAEYVVWHGETRAHTPSVYYLHGALHLFDDAGKLQKYTWIRTGDRLKEQAREEMDAGKYPLFVSEGTSQQKFDRIRHNAYLYQGLKTLYANAKQKRHCFFVHGHSLADNDYHIFRLISRGACSKLYVSIHGDPDSPSNRELISNAQKIQGERDDKVPLELVFYDSDSAQVWDRY